MAMRRNARLRREYLYKKSLEGKAKEEYERKERLRAALQGEFVILKGFGWCVQPSEDEREDNRARGG